MPRHKKKKRAAAATAAVVKRTDWLVGDLVVAKLRGHRPWPAQIQKPEDYGYDPRPHRIFVTFFGTEETCFCSYNKITPFTTVVRKNLAEQLQKINTNPELERAIKEIFAADDEMKISSKAHGSSQKEDEEMVSEKSEDDEPPVEPRSRKRGRVVEETVAPPVPVADERPAKMEKTVKNMAAEQVQKLPRKVRIKVSTQGSDLGSTQQQGRDRAGVSSSQARHSEPVDSVKIPVKNGDRTTTAGKVDNSVGEDSSVPLKEGGEIIIVEVEETVRHDASENGGDTNKDPSDKDPVEKMEVEDQESLVSETTSEPPSGKEDAEKPVVLHIREHAVEKEDAEKPAPSKTSEPAVEKKDAEKPIVPKITEPAVEKEKTGDDVAEKMEVDEHKLTTTSRPATVEEESGKSDGPTLEESTILSTNEQQVNQSSEAKAQEETHTVEDMDTARAGQVEGVPPAKEVVVDAPKSESQSGVGAEKADDGLQNKLSSASTKQDATDEEAPTKDPASVVSASTKDEEKKEQKDGVVQAQQVSAKDDFVSRTDVGVASAPGQTPSDTTDQGSQFHGSEVDASRSNLEGGAVYQTGENRDGSVKKIEDQNGTVNEAVNQDEDVKMTENQDGTLKNVEDHDDGLKQTEDQGPVAKETGEHATEMKKTEEQDATAELKKIENQDAKKAEDQDIKVKKIVEHAAESKKTEEQDATAELKKIENQDAGAKEAEHQDIEVKKTVEHAAELKKTEEQDVTAELIKIEEEDVGVTTKEDKEVVVKETDAKDGAVNEYEMSTEAEGDVGKRVSSTTPAAKAEGATPQIDIGGKAEVPTPVAKQEDTATSGTTGNGEVPSTGKEGGDNAQSVEAEKMVEVSTAVAN